MGKNINTYKIIAILIEILYISQNIHKYNPHNLNDLQQFQNKYDATLKEQLHFNSFR